MYPFKSGRIRASHELTRNFINAEYSRRGVGTVFKGTLDEAHIKKAADTVVMRDIPTFMKLPGNFDSPRTQRMLRRKIQWFFEGLKTGKIHVFNRKSVTSDMKWSVEEFGALRTRKDTTVLIFIERTRREMRTANA